MNTSKVCLFLAGLSLLLSPVIGSAQTADNFLDDSILHEIRLDIRPSDWQSLKDQFRENDYYPANLRWRFQGSEIQIDEIGIRSRGTGSRSPVKPGLRVDFNQYDSNRRFLGMKSVVLRNNTQDASMMNERLAMAFLRRMGLPASREAHTRLYVNDQYVGLYTIVESVDQAFLRRHFAEDEGYLYKYDYPQGQAPYFFEDRGPDPSLYSPSPFQPETHENNPKPVPLAAMIQAMSKATDAEFESVMSQYLDLRKFLTEVAVEAFLAEQDGIIGDYGLNNFYLYNFQSSNRFQFVAWDKSNTFFSPARSIWHNVTTNVLVRRATAVASLRSAYIDALLRSASAAGGPGGWLEQEIARVYGQIRIAALEDPYKQCDPGQTGNLRACSNEEFEAAAATLTQFARQRNDMITRELAQTTNFPPDLGLRAFSVFERGAFSLKTGGGGGSFVIGYGRIQPNASNSTPAGIAIFGLRQNNVLVSEAAVPASPLLQNGRIYAEVSGPVNTGFAMVNPNEQAATISFYFTDSSGRDFGQGAFTLGAGSQIAKFLSDAPFNSGSLTNSSFTFSSTLPVAVIALRGFTNEQSEFLMTTLPVIDLSKAAGDASIIPHFADGAGFTSQIVLVNPSDAAISGTIQFMSPGSSTSAGQPLTLTLEGISASSFPYTIAPRGAIRLRTAGTGSDLRTGSVRIMSNNSAPVPLLIFTLKTGTLTVSEAGVPATGVSSAFRMYVERSGPVLSALAVANPSAAPANVTFELNTLSGQSTGLTGSATVPANGQIAVFLDQIQGLGGIPADFKGVLRISTSSPAGISVLGLRSRYNERQHFLMTTTTPVIEGMAPPAGELFFPHLVDAGGYTTQFILYSGYSGQTSTGLLRYFSQSGQPLGLSLQ